MINDVINGGLGTSDGSNTATTKPAAGGSPNIIIANPTPQNSTNAVGVPQISTKAPTTYNPGSTTAPDIVGAGVTTAGTLQQLLFLLFYLLQLLLLSLQL